jgi:HPt (histidine-containing phosphotransfer) domain-containing protein
MGLNTPERFKGKEAFYEKMVRMFVKDLPAQWADFDTAAADLEGTKKFVHTIKGVAGNLEATAIYQSAVDFEASLRANEPNAALYQKFIEACNDLKNALPA